MQVGSKPGWDRSLPLLEIGSVCPVQVLPRPATLISALDRRTGTRLRVVRVVEGAPGSGQLGLVAGSDPVIRTW